jgi:NAD-dependent deacetylase
MALEITNALKSLLVPSTRVVVLTGAGVSAESGVPTFRGSGGFWGNFKVQDYATPQAFQTDPQRVWEWYNWRREEILKAGPNPGHHAIHEFEEYFTEFTLVTQNVDGLHERAGSRKILKLHGDIWETRCSVCGHSVIDAEARKEPLPPICSCGGQMRPGVVWFGEFLPKAIYEQATIKSENCDLFFAVGTSAEVYPAAALPSMAKQQGAYVTEVNIERTAAASYADEVLMGRSGEVLPGLVEHFTPTWSRPT